MKAPEEAGGGHGTYIGGDERLRGKTALIRRREPGGVLQAQFDDVLTLPKEFTHGWTPFADGEFDVNRWGNSPRG
jgi:hypothetical protein